MSHSRIPKELHKINFNYSETYIQTVSLAAKAKRRKLARNRKRIEERMPKDYFSNKNEKEKKCINT